MKKAHNKMAAARFLLVGGVVLVALTVSAWCVVRNQERVAQINFERLAWIEEKVNPSNEWEAPDPPPKSTLAQVEVNRIAAELEKVQSHSRKRALYQELLEYYDSLIESNRQQTIDNDAELWQLTSERARIQSLLDSLD